MVVTAAVKPGEPVKRGQKLLSLEAMKMETTVHSDRDARIAHVIVRPGSQVEAGNLLMTFA